MSAPLSIRFDEGILDRLRQRAAKSYGATPSGLAQRLVDEGLRQLEHPGVVFRDGPSGRRAALALGPDVWEAIRVLREVDERGEPAIDAAADLLQLTPTQVRVALRYYTDFGPEIDAELAEADTASLDAERAWQAERQLLA
jgi:hypothetical protein